MTTTKPLPARPSPQFERKQTTVLETAVKGGGSVAREEPEPMRPALPTLPRLDEVRRLPGGQPTVAVAPTAARRRRRAKGGLDRIPSLYTRTRSRRVEPGRLASRVAIGSPT